jgi:hypothetical protein
LDKCCTTKIKIPSRNSPKGDFYFLALSNQLLAVCL